MSCETECEAEKLSAVATTALPVDGPADSEPTPPPAPSPPANPRNIFRFFDGTNQRGVDPLAVWRALLTHPTFSMEKHPEMACPKADSGIAPDHAAMTIMLDAIREAFGVDPFSEVNGVATGLTDGETLKLWFDLSFFLADLKKNIK